MMCVWWRSVRLRLKTLCWGDVRWGDPCAWISQYWCWGGSWWGDSKSDLDFHSLMIGGALIDSCVFSVQHRDSGCACNICADHVWRTLLLVVAYFVYAPCHPWMMSHTSSSWVLLILLILIMHSLLLKCLWVLCCSEVICVCVSGILRSCRWWHCLWHWTSTWVLKNSVQVRWCTTKTINADQWSQDWLKADVHKSGVMWSRPHPLRMLLIS